MELLATQVASSFMFMTYMEFLHGVIFFLTLPQ